MIGTRSMRSLLTLWIILIQNTESFAQFKTGFMFPTSICEGKDGGLFPMFGSCQGYYICNNGIAIVGTCDEKNRFNPTTLQCDDARKVHCPYEMLDDGDQDDIDDMDDMDDIESDLSELESDEMEEPSTTRRPPPTKQKPIVSIVKPNKELQNTSSIERLCLGKKNGVTLVKEGSCTEYYVCKSKHPQLRHCPSQQHFSPHRHICMKVADAKCTFNQESNQEIVYQDTPAVTAGLCSEMKQDALVPHREDCGKFLLCSNMMFLVMDCPAGLHFNAEAKRCDYPKIAQCELQKEEKQTKKSNKKSLSKRKPKKNTL
ncbi:chondroitin proteoglycan-2 [Drosophila innubila]|uniref:chondroitin proteoglycan-2 n=1 Tax=Drosophila innubila TaxID=198719 RepID=UPI00148B57CC|nr:chondroitin proteoglycan-2 [Drosophila innubila]